MKVQIFSSESEATSAVASRICERLKESPAMTFLLPTGRTPLGLYRQLVARHRAGDADFSEASTFNLDEFVGLDRDDPGSFRAYLERHFVSQVNLAPGRVHFLDGSAADLREECAQYEDRLEAVGGVDLCLLGIGGNGHLAFNEPAGSLPVRTHRAKLTAQTRQANAALFGDDPVRVPVEALTVGIGTILASREIALLAFGESKREAVRRMLAGEVTPELPASFLQLHPRVTVYLDRSAAP